MRIIYGFWIVVVGFVVVLAALAMTIKLGELTDAKDVTSMVSAVTGVVGTLTDAFFGVHAGAVGKEKADSERREAQRELTTLAVLAEPDIARRALNIQ